MAKILITGGAGFIGCNVAESFSREGHEIVVFDNLSRRGTEMNLKWLLTNHPGITHQSGDLRKEEDITTCFKDHGPFDIVFHLAGQVAVTTSVDDPKYDFEVNALGTFLLLEAVRNHSPNSIVLYASTNKVYGDLPGSAVVEEDSRYRYRELAKGIDESASLDFHSPYGCSKGTADQYMIDYARIYGLKTVVFRQSCIYGYRQFGIEDQGWVAWFTLAALTERPITVFGNGKQVRDILFIDDLVSAYRSAITNIETAKGQAYNVGGGNFNLSLLELLDILEELLGRKIDVTYDDWRPGDQKVFIANTDKAKSSLNWEPKVNTREGLERLSNWMKDNSQLFKDCGLI